MNKSENSILSEQLLLENEIFNDEMSLMEELKKDIKNVEKDVKDKPDNGSDKLSKNKMILDKTKKILAKMQKMSNDEDYLVNGAHYHSRLLYKLCTKFPFIGNSLGPSLISITSLITNNASRRKYDREKMINLYRSYKDDKVTVDGKIEFLEKLQKPTKEQKEQLVTLKKMSSELDANMKKLDYNYDMSNKEDRKEKEEKERKSYKNHQGF